MEGGGGVKVDDERIRLERATRVAEAWWEKDADGERAGTCFVVEVLLAARDVIPP